MKQKTPSISIVIPTYNASNTLGKCLESIKKQDYPKNKIETIIIDDDSEDQTVAIAKKYTKKILRNGKHNCEIGKSIGIQNAKNELILLLDADNIMQSKNWLKKIVKPLTQKPNIVASYPIWFNYNKSDSIADRYCSLFGINDPFQFYTKKQDRLMWIEKKWRYGGTPQDMGNYFLVKFKKTDRIPTLGTIGFLVRKKLVKKTNYKPYFFHVDSCQEIVNQGHGTFAMVKTPITHLHSESVLSFLKKLKRNIDLYLEYKKIRKYQWSTSEPSKLMTSVLKMSSVIIPVYDSIRGYLKIRDEAWFLHPFLCLSTLTIYTYTYLMWKIKKILGF